MRHFYSPADKMLGKYTEFDGTIRFYSRVHTLLNHKSVVLDLGAGRGSWFYEDDCDYRRKLRNIKEYVGEFIGADIDEEILKNPTTTKNLLIVDGKIPIKDNSIDIIISDYVLEHIKDPKIFFTEINRILKKNGFFCARTPHKYDYISVLARLIKNKNHHKLIKFAQPFRKPEDVFDTYYKLNTLREIRRYFKGYINFSYLQPSDPNYYFGKKWIYKTLLFIHRFLPLVMYSNIFVFLKKN